MKLVFIHGWGLDPSIWDGIAPRLQYPRQHVDLGFYNNASHLSEDGPAILIGHSLGFVHGMKNKKDWEGWIAINSFPRFVKTTDNPGCASAAELRDIRIRLEADPHKTLKDFHAYIGAQTPPGTPNPQRLREGLDELRNNTIENDLQLPGLVLASRNDPLVPVSTSEALAKSHEISWHESGGHILPQSDPVWCVNAIEEFLKRYE